MNKDFFKGKAIIITGVSSGIGLATSNAILEQGGIVLGFGRNKPEIKHLNFHFFETDIRKFEEVQKSVSLCVEKHENEIYGLINNAGLGIFGAIESLSNEDWHLMFDTNVHGLMYMSKLIVPILKKKKAGHIINISSIAGLDGVFQGSGYSATKFAVKGISQSMYKELRLDGVKVSCVYPGSVSTHFFDEIPSVKVNDSMLKPTDIADTLMFLLSTDSNCLPVDIELRPLQPKK